MIKSTFANLLGGKLMALLTIGDQFPAYTSPQ